MDCPCLLDRTLNGLTVSVQSPNSVNWCFCLLVWLPAFLTHPHHFTSLSLHASVLLLLLPQLPNSQPPALLKNKQTTTTNKKYPFTSSHLLHLICWTRIWSHIGPNRRYCLSRLFSMCCLWTSQVFCVSLFIGFACHLSQKAAVVLLLKAFYLT